MERCSSAMDIAMECSIAMSIAHECRMRGFEIMSGRRAWRRTCLKCATGIFKPLDTQIMSDDLYQDLRFPRSSLDSSAVRNSTHQL